MTTWLKNNLQVIEKWTSVELLDSEKKRFLIYWDSFTSIELRREKCNIFGRCKILKNLRQEILKIMCIYLKHKKKAKPQGDSYIYVPVCIHCVIPCFCDAECGVCTNGVWQEYGQGAVHQETGQPPFYHRAEGGCGDHAQLTQGLPNRR